jgi:hypothetical protein
VTHARTQLERPVDRLEHARIVLGSEARAEQRNRGFAPGTPEHVGGQTPDVPRRVIDARTQMD